MGLLKYRTSKIIPLIITFIIPLAFAANMGYEIYFNNMLLDKDLTEAELKIFVENKFKLPLGQLITFASVIISTVIARKAVREGTHNTFVKTHKDLKSEEN
jgi:hypothetical protein